jgi:tetratricopeptide (TPR) repeat protein
VGKLLGFLFGISLVFLFGVVAWRVYPEEITPFLPAELFGIRITESTESPPIIRKDSEQNEQKPNITEKEPEPTEPEELKDADALLERGTNYLNAGYLSMAINDYLQAAAIAPQNRMVWTRLIPAQMAFRDFASAEESSKKALELFPNDPELLILLGETHIQKSEFSDAKRIFFNMPEGAAKNFYLGALAAYFDDYPAAKELLEPIRENPEFGKQASLLLGAFEEFSLFPEGNPLHLKLLLAKAFNDLRFFEMSVQMTKNILKTEEKYRDAWIILGHSYLSLGRYDLAINVLGQALELDPTKPETAFFLGLSESAMEDYDSSITHLSMARENGYVPQAEVTKALADAFLNGEFYDAARKEYEKLLDVQGAPVENYVQPIRISLEFLDDPDAAERLAKKAVENHPDSETAKNLLAWALLEDEEYGQARVILEEIIAENEAFAPAHLNLGKIAEEEEKYEEALEHYRTAYDLSPHTESGTLAAERYNAIVLQQ